MSAEILTYFYACGSRRSGTLYECLEDYSSPLFLSLQVNPEIEPDEVLKTDCYILLPFPSWHFGHVWSLGLTQDQKKPGNPFIPDQRYSLCWVRCLWMRVIDGELGVNLFSHQRHANVALQSDRSFFIIFTYLVTFCIYLLLYYFFKSCNVSQV